MIAVEHKKEFTDKLIAELEVANEHANGERDGATVEAEKCAVLAAEAEKIQMAAKKELDEAVPAMEQANKAIDCLDKNSIQELKSMTKPPQECEKVCAACGYLLLHEKR